MKKALFILIFVLSNTSLSWAAFSNYNTILIGDRAAGMGGAFTALTGDPSGSSFYNPAALARSGQSTFSAAANVYAKYDVKFGEPESLLAAPLRINRGRISSIPASSGTVYSFGNFALGLSIIFPDFDIYNGDIVSTTNDTNSFLNLRDESLWIGGSVALNISEKSALGLTMYYTLRGLSRSVSDKSLNGSVTSITTEDKSLSQNSLIYILGYYTQLNPQWSFGFSHRFSSLPIDGTGTYFKTQIDTNGSTNAAVAEFNIPSSTRIPSKTTIGLGFKDVDRKTYSLDISFYGTESYYDLIDPSISDFIQHRETWNINLGYEEYLRDWLALRLGLFTNYSSQPRIPDNPNNQRYGDHIDMWGFSTNFAIYTSDKTTITLGGFYTGGQGQSTQQTGQQVIRIEKSLQIFSFLVGTSFVF
ncbi:MAG: hypothetical protein KDD50_00325 [Bdellovibrionales bacterium]|nr:hypothetical protein [Bdellovibrionales bacterium]